MKQKNLSEWAVALIVVACSGVLLFALAFALTGRMAGAPDRTVRVNFRDVTGINLGSRVKYAGAVAGKVTAIRMLAAEEREASGDPRNAVAVELALFKGVPALHADASVTVAADTLLSDKFILISGGNPAAPLLAEGAVLQGVAPTTFDKLLADLDSTLSGVNGLIDGGGGGGTGEIFAKLRSLLEETQSLIAGAKPVVSDARVLAADARSLVADNKVPVTQAVADIGKAAASFESLASRGNTWMAGNEKSLTSAVTDFKVSAENLKVTSTYTKILARNLTLRPSQLIWGNSRPPTLPSEQEILRARRPIPAN